MTNPELITNKMILKAWIAAWAAAKQNDLNSPDCIKAAILAIQDDITRPVYNLLRGYKQDADAYERALAEIRVKQATICSTRECKEIADRALKGDYHKTDFTDFCEKYPTKEETSL